MTLGRESFASPKMLVPSTADGFPVHVLMNDDGRRKHLDLFSGIGGFALAAYWAGFETVAFCEQDRFCQGVLGRHWPHVPIIDDVHDFRGGDYGATDLLTGGFPCQPFSTAGQRRGEKDDRALWPQMARVIQEARPTWILAENVAGIVSLGIDDVLADLEGMEYACQTFIVPACAVGAPHRRDRVWIVGNAEHDGFTSSEERGRLQSESKEQGRSDQIGQSKGTGSASEDVADSASGRCEERETQRQPENDIGKKGERRRTDSRNVADSDHQRQLQQKRRLDYIRGRSGNRNKDVHDCERQKRDAKSDVGLLAHGLSAELVHGWDREPEGVPRVTGRMKDRVNMLKGLGNAIVPQVAYEFLRLMK